MAGILSAEYISLGRQVPVCVQEAGPVQEPPADRGADQDLVSEQED